MRIPIAIPLLLGTQPPSNRVVKQTRAEYYITEETSTLGRSITGYSVFGDPSMTYLPSYAFMHYHDGNMGNYYCVSDEVAFPALQTIGEHGMDQIFAHQEYGSVKTIRFDNLETIEAYGMNTAFQRQYKIDSIIGFSKLKSIGDYGMRSIFANTRWICDITSMSFDKLEYIGDYGMDGAFYYVNATNTSTTSGTVQIGANLTHVGAYGLQSAFAFAGPVQLSFDVSFPKLTTLNRYAMASTFGGAYTKIGNATFGALKTISDYGMYNTFRGVNTLSSVNFPALETVGAYGMQSVFYNCTKLSSVVFPALTTIGVYGFSGAFFNNTSLHTVKFPALTTIGASAFEYAFSCCSALQTVEMPAIRSYQPNMLPPSYQSPSAVIFHFATAVPLAEQSKILSYYSGFSSRILFDL